MNAAGWLSLVLSLGVALAVTIWGWWSLFSGPRKEED